jgi:hypothetical protein|tara:strand:- start:1474 stop:1665 length:192 start_codon:yes stop_codon:yes gene_type:complete
MNNLDSSKITLSQPSKAFEYEKISREIEQCRDIDTVKEALKCYLKLYLKQQETLKAIGVPNEL